jgi:hypothetical protein
MKTRPSYLSEPLFTVIEGEKTYHLYDDGKIEGFGARAIVVNRTRILLDKVVDLMENSYPQTLASPMSNSTGSVGSSHGIPE